MRVQAGRSTADESLLWNWGAGGLGGLGNNSTSNQSSPVQTVASGTNWNTISAGYSVMAIKTDGTLWCWGQNGDGSIGDNTSGINRLSPVQTIAGGTNWSQASVGRYATVAAIKTDGTLWTWGNNSYGQLGNNTSGAANKKSSPIQTSVGGSNWSQVSVG
jgi:alpha-tubulin suppressor-like RCC1 family protein